MKPRQPAFQVNVRCQRPTDDQEIKNVICRRSSMSRVRSRLPKRLPSTFASFVSVRWKSVYDYDRITADIAGRKSPPAARACGVTPSCCRRIRPRRWISGPASRR